MWSWMHFRQCLNHLKLFECRGCHLRTLCSYRSCLRVSSYIDGSFAAWAENTLASICLWQIIQARFENKNMPVWWHRIIPSMAHCMARAQRLRIPKSGCSSLWQDIVTSSSLDGSQQSLSISHLLLHCFVLPTVPAEQCFSEFLSRLQKKGFKRGSELTAGEAKAFFYIKLLSAIWLHSLY